MSSDGGLGWSKPGVRESAVTEGPIAIVGIGCRFPGGANSPESYWRLLRDGVDAIREVPEDRWHSDEFYDPDPATPGKMQARAGGFLEDHDRFDADFFGISPREASRMDPQQRLALEVSWEALEDAGIPRERLAGSATGVFFGVSSFDFLMAQVADRQPAEPYFATGVAHSILTGRLSYWFDLVGPSVPVDTACSSSLVAVNLACKALRDGDCRSAIAGGVNVMLVPELSLCFAMGGFLAPDGRCKTFDARADGYVRGEGCGVVVLKRLDDALADRDRIYALIRGSAVNQDGKSAGLTAPKAASQAAVIRRALELSGVAATEVGYVEAHGTGTPLGDPIEVEALTEVLGAPRPDDRTCPLGTVKTNIGHLEAAAGIAGLIKAALSLRREAIPPNLHFEELNPHISLDDTPFFVPTQLVAWPKGSKRRIAGVSSFGFSGTNAHVVLEEAPEAPTSAEVEPAEMRAHLLPISARSDAALRDLAARYRDQIRDSESDATLPALCEAASLRRSHHTHRAAVVATRAEEMADRLDSLARGEPATAVYSGSVSAGRRRSAVAFVFSGQGGQRSGMGLGLARRSPPFREMLERCDHLIRRHALWSIFDELALPDADSRLQHTEVAQPAIFALQVALAAHWRSCGVEPDVVVGHSVGEVAAAHIAGALDLEQAVELVFHRARLMQRVTGQGRMVAVALSSDELAARLGRDSPELSIAAINGPRASVLSGETQAIEQRVAQLEAAGVDCRWLPVNYAFHSPQMTPIAAEFQETLAKLSPEKTRIRMISTLTGLAVEGPELDSSYWSRNLRQPVLFAEAVRGLLASGCNTFIEMSAHPVLMAAVQEQAEAISNERCAVVGSLRRDVDEESAILESLADLYAQRRAPDWSRRISAGAVHRDLPTYPWQHQKHWYDRGLRGSPGSLRRRVQLETGDERVAHPLLERVFVPMSTPESRFWESDLSERQIPYLADHQVGGAAVFPAAGYAELALAVAHELYGDGPVVVEGLRFERPLLVPEVQARIAHVVSTFEGVDRATLEIHSRGAEESAGVCHARASIRRAPSVARRPDSDSMADLRKRVVDPVVVDDYYELLRVGGLEYGPMFRGIDELYRGHGEALARVVLPEKLSFAAREYVIHPAQLDAAFQVAGVALFGDGSHSAAGGVVPVGLDSLVVPLRCPGEVWVHAIARDVEGDSRLSVDLRLFDREGEVVAEARGLQLQRIGAASSTELHDSAYTVAWRSADLAASQRDSLDSRSGRWLVLADRSELGTKLAAAIEAAGGHCVRVVAGDAYTSLDDGSFELDPSSRAGFESLLRDAFPSGGEPCAGIVDLWSLDAAPAEAAAEPAANAERRCTELLRLLRSIVGRGWRDLPKLWLVTRGAQTLTDDAGLPALEQAPVWAMARTLAQEHPELPCTRIDLDPHSDESDAVVLAGELWGDDAESEIAVRAGQRFVARLARAGAALVPQDSSSPTREVAGDRSFRLETRRAGLLDDLTLREVPRLGPGPGEVEIRVVAAGLNFKDVLLAMGVVPSPVPGLVPLGGECAGEVVAVGDGVHDLEPGDSVIAVAPWSFGRFATAPREYVVRKPEALDFQQAAAVPLVFMTALYALEHVGRMAPGERVLVHAGAGGVGAAAIQLARVRGAEVFATAGSPEKRRLLSEEWGVEHVMDSRSLDFADEILEATAGAGVDLVLNSLSGAAIEKNLEVLAPYGRFLEIGVRDIYENHRVGLLPFQRNLSYSAIDLSRLAAERPASFGELLREVLTRFESGALVAPPVKAFPIQQAESAFRYMAQAQHVGKIALDFSDAERAQIEPLAAPLFRADASYLITGGLGGLGCSLATWLVDRGVRHLILVGRSRPTSDADAAIESLRKQGARVDVAALDVSDRPALASLFARIHEQGPPLRGIFHAAGVLADATLLEMEPDDIARVMAPKAAGAWNLHELAGELDHFVLFSSAASLVGSAGQANYAAANGFLDALAHTRASQGLPALSVNWGPWSEVGMAAVDPSRGRRLAALGIESIDPARGWAALEEILGAGLTQLGVLRLDLRRWFEFFPAATGASFLSELSSDAGGEAPPVDTRFLSELSELESPGARRDFIEMFLRREIARALRLDPDDIDSSQPFAEMGFDSLIAVEFKNRLETSVGVRLNATVLFAHPTLESVIPLIAQQLGVDLDSSAEPAPARAEDDEAHTRAVEALSDAQAREELERELAELSETSGGGG